MVERYLPGEREKTKGKAPMVGCILDVQRHPSADRLYIAKVQVPQLDLSIPVKERYGPQTIKTIVFGGNRVLKPGELVPVALPGIKLPNGEKVRERNWRGVRSQGMLLSLDELGWTMGGPDEVAVLDPQEAEAGMILGSSNPATIPIFYLATENARRNGAVVFYPHAGVANTFRPKGVPRTDVMPFLFEGINLHRSSK